MDFDYITQTDLQRSPQKIFSKKPFKILLKNNKPNGMFISEEAVEIMMKSGVFDQIREELYELQDEETVKVITDHRSGKSKPTSFDDFTEEYGL